MSDFESTFVPKKSSVRAADKVVVPSFRLTAECTYTGREVPSKAIHQAFGEANLPFHLTAIYMGRNGHPKFRLEASAKEYRLPEDITSPEILRDRFAQHITKVRGVKVEGVSVSRFQELF